MYCLPVCRPEAMHATGASSWGQATRAAGTWQVIKLFIPTMSLQGPLLTKLSVAPTGKEKVKLFKGYLFIFTKQAK